MAGFFLDVGEVMQRALIMGIFGGIVRASVGLLKHYESEQRRKMNPRYLVSSLLIAAATGALAGVICEGDWRLSALAGYAGSDFLESMCKMKFRRVFFSE